METEWLTLYSKEQRVPLARLESFTLKTSFTIPVARTSALPENLSMPENIPSGMMSEN
jgi:hypothetical protein